VTASNGRPFSFEHLSKVDNNDARNLLRLFGGAPSKDVDRVVAEIGPTRLAFWDCALDPAWLAAVRARNILATEAKSENSINRIAGVAEHPRFTERVIAGAEFNFRLSLKVVDGEDLLPLLLEGLKLLEADSLGGSGSRGYGKVVLSKLALDGEPLQPRFDAIQLFASAA